MEISTVSINFSDGSKEYLLTENGLGIIYECLQAARNNRPMFSLLRSIHGWQIWVRSPGESLHRYVKNYRNGEFTWCRDYTYAKEFSLETAKKHILELYGMK